MILPAMSLASCDALISSMGDEDATSVDAEVTEDGDVMMKDNDDSMMENDHMDDDSMMDDNRMENNGSMEDDDSMMMDDEKMDNEDHMEDAMMDDAAYIEASLQMYSDAAFASALADGKTVILDFHADWCPVCKSNEPKIKAAFESSSDTDLVGFVVDYDNAIELRKQFGITMQSTLIKVEGSSVAEVIKVDTLGPGYVEEAQVTAFLEG